jgi:hypothetical protein
MASRTCGCGESSSGSPCATCCGPSAGPPDPAGGRAGGGVTALTPDELLFADQGVADALLDGGFVHATPLWFYVLMEAEGRAEGRRRNCFRIVHVVTAFAVGHSITLALAALGYLSAPTRLVESMIALSILVSAVHALC